MSGFVTVSIGSGLVDPIFGKCQVPLAAYIEQQGEAFERDSVMKYLFNFNPSRHWAEQYSSETAMDDFVPVGEGGEYPRTGFESGYDRIIENMTFKQSFSVTQELVEDAQLGEMKRRARKLITAYGRTREKFGRALYAGGLYGKTVSFGGKSFACNSADGLALFHKEHVNKVNGKKQCNLYKGSFTASLLGKIETEMQQLTGDNGELLAVSPDTIWIPNDAALKDAVFSAVGADKEPATSNNAYNVQYGRWNIIVDPYLTQMLQVMGKTDKPFFLLDSKFMQNGDGAIFQERKKLEVKSIIDQNNDNNSWRGRARFGAGFVDWRFVAAGNISTGKDLT
nr:MAG TPA: Major capsid protein [Caudoviricetes sp.]